MPGLTAMRLAVCSAVFRFCALLASEADVFLDDGVPFIYRGLPGAAEVRPGPVNTELNTMACSFSSVTVSNVLALKG